jgi:hypothetical protein
MIRGREVVRLRQQCDDCDECNSVELEDVIQMIAHALFIGDMLDVRTATSGGTHVRPISDDVEIVFTWQEPFATDVLLVCPKP